MYINPTAGASSPGVSAEATVTSFDVGTITGIGFQNNGGGFAIIADEIRVGDSYEEVVSEGGVVVIPPPVITDLSPTTGLTDGGTLVSITGSNFLDGATVHFGENEGLDVSVNSSNSISATTPPSLPGLVSVIVANTNGLSRPIYMDLRLKSHPHRHCLLPNGARKHGVNGFNDALCLVWFRTFFERAHDHHEPLRECGLDATDTNIFGNDALSTNSYGLMPSEPVRFFSFFRNRKRLW